MSGGAAYSDADLDAILASVGATARTNRADRWLIHELLTARNPIQYSDAQLDRVLDAAGRVWELQPEAAT